MRDSTKATRAQLINYLNKHKIGTRLLFGGNLIRQPYFKNVGHRKIGTLVNTDLVMNNSFWIGLYPGLAYEHLTYVSETLRKFFKDERII